MGKINPTPLKPASTTTPVSTAELGKAVAAEQTAHQTFEGQKKELKAADDAYKADPSNKTLAARRQTLVEKATAAFGKWETAKAGVEAAVSKLAGGGKASEQAGRLHERLPEAKKQLADVQQQIHTETTKLTRAVADAQAALKRAEKSGSMTETSKLEKAALEQQAKVNQLNQKRDGLAATVAGLEKGIESRQGAALGEARAAKKPVANEVVDIADLASKSVDEQVRLSGAPVVTVSQDQAIAVDAARIEQALKASPENGVKMLAMQLRGAEPHVQSKLLEKVGPQISQMVNAAQSNPNVAGALLDTLKETHGSARLELARKLVEGATGPYSPMLSAGIHRLTHGNGTVEGEALVRALRAGKREDLAGPLNAVLTQKVSAVQEDFVEKARDVQKLNGDLARLVVGFGPMMNNVQKSAAIDAFKARHKEEYEAYEAAGAKMAPMLQYAIESGSTQMQALIPEFLATKAGERAVMEGLAAQQEGKPGLLDALTKAASRTGDGIKIAGAVSTVMAKGVGLRSIELARAGRLGEAEKLVGTLKNNAKLFGVEPKAMEGITEKMTAVLKSGGQKAAVDGLKQEFKNLDTNAPGFTGRSAQALKGLGVALSAVSVIDNLGKFGELKVHEQIKTVADGISTGVDGGLLAMEIIGKSNPASKLVHLGKRVSAVAGAVGAVMDAISAADSFKKGDHAEGVAGSASAVGGAILATYAFAAAAGVQALPVAGQIIGAVLVIGGTIAKWTIEERKAAKKEKGIEDDAQAFLEAAGIDKARADELSDLKRDDGRNVGMVVKELAPLIGMTPKALFDHLLKLTPKQIDAFVDHTKDVKVEGGRFRVTGDHGLSVTAHWMVEDGLLPKGTKLPPLK